jgi:hypothetical protein
VLYLAAEDMAVFGADAGYQRSRVRLAARHLISRPIGLVLLAGKVAPDEWKRQDNLDRIESLIERKKCDIVRSIAVVTSPGRIAGP